METDKDAAENKEFPITQIFLTLNSQDGNDDLVGSVNASLEEKDDNIPIESTEKASIEDIKTLTPSSIESDSERDKQDFVAKATDRNAQTVWELSDVVLEERGVNNELPQRKRMPPLIAIRRRNLKQTRTEVTETLSEACVPLSLSQLQPTGGRDVKPLPLLIKVADVLSQTLAKSEDQSQSKKARTRTPTIRSEPPQLSQFSNSAIILESTPREIPGTLGCISQTSLETVREHQPSFTSIVKASSQANETLIEPRTTASIDNTAQDANAKNIAEIFIQCPICGCIFNLIWNNNLKKHLLLKYSKQISDDGVLKSETKIGTTYPCKQCEVVVAEQLTEDQGKCMTESAFTEELVEGVTTRSDYENSMLYCGLCEKGFHTTVSLRLHLAKCHGDIHDRVILDPSFKCSRCLQEFLTSKSLICHAVDCRTIIPTLTITLQLQKGVMDCKLSRNNLTEHFKTHHGLTRKEVCGQLCCSNGVSGIMGTLRHLARVHLNPMEEKLENQNTAVTLVYTLNIDQSAQSVPPSTITPNHGSHGFVRPPVAPANSSASHGFVRPPVAPANSSASHGFVRPSVPPANSSASHGFVQPPVAPANYSASHGFVQPPVAPANSSASHGFFQPPVAPANSSASHGFVRPSVAPANSSASHGFVQPSMAPANSSASHGFFQPWTAPANYFASLVFVRPSMAPANSSTSHGFVQPTMAPADSSASHGFVRSSLTPANCFSCLGFVQPPIAPANSFASHRFVQPYMVNPNASPSVSQSSIALPKVYPSFVLSSVVLPNVHLEAMVPSNVSPRQMQPLTVNQNGLNHVDRPLMVIPGTDQQLICPSIASQSESPEIIRPSVITTQIIQPSMATRSESAEMIRPSVITPNEGLQIIQPAKVTQIGTPGIIRPSILTQNIGVGVIQPPMVMQSGSPAIIRPTIFAQNESPAIIRLSMIPPNIGLQVIQPSMVTQSGPPGMIGPSIFTPNVGVGVIQPSMVRQTGAPGIIRPPMLTPNICFRMIQPPMVMQSGSPAIIRPSIITQNVSPAINRPTMVTQSGSPAIIRPSMAISNVNPCVLQPSGINQSVSLRPTQTRNEQVILTSNLVYIPVAIAYVRNDILQNQRHSAALLNFGNTVSGNRHIPPSVVSASTPTLGSRVFSANSNPTIHNISFASAAVINQEETPSDEDTSEE